MNSDTRSKYSRKFDHSPTIHNFTIQMPFQSCIQFLTQFSNCISISFSNSVDTSVDTSVDMHYEETVFVDVSAINSGTPKRRKLVGEDKNAGRNPFDIWERAEEDIEVINID